MKRNWISLLGVVLALGLASCSPVYADDLSDTELQSGDDQQDAYIEVWTSNGNVYAGTRENGVITGTGKCTYESGNIYTGQWENGTWNGAGRYLWADSGGTWEGLFTDGAMSYGVLTAGNGKWVGPSFNYVSPSLSENGSWRVRFFNDRSYDVIISQCSVVDGEWVKDGLSFILNSDESSYTCTWYEKGEEVSSSLESRTDESGNKITGLFESADGITGTLVWEYNTESGTNYRIGSFTDGKMNGQGVYLHSDGDVNCGEYQNNVAEGQGMRYYVSTGNWYAGSFHNNYRDGDGIMYEDGTFYEMSYQSGEIVTQQILNIGDFD